MKTVTHEQVTGRCILFRPAKPTINSSRAATVKFEGMKCVIESSALNRSTGRCGIDVAKYLANPTMEQITTLF